MPESNSKAAYDSVSESEGEQTTETSDEKRMARYVNSLCKNVAITNCCAKYERRAKALGYRKRGVRMSPAHDSVL